MKRVDAFDRGTRCVHHFTPRFHCVRKLTDTTARGTALRSPRPARVSALIGMGFSCSHRGLSSIASVHGIDPHCLGTSGDRRSRRSRCSRRVSLQRFEVHRLQLWSGKRRMGQLTRPGLLLHNPSLHILRTRPLLTACFNQPGSAVCASIPRRAPLGGEPRRLPNKLKRRKRGSSVFKPEGPNPKRTNLTAQATHPDNVEKGESERGPLSKQPTAPPPRRTLLSQIGRGASAPVIGVKDIERAGARVVDRKSPPETRVGKPVSPPNQPAFPGPGRNGKGPGAARTFRGGNGRGGLPVRKRLVDVANLRERRRRTQPVTKTRAPKGPYHAKSRRATGRRPLDSNSALAKVVWRAPQAAVRRAAEQDVSSGAVNERHLLNTIVELGRARKWQAAEAVFGGAEDGGFVHTIFTYSSMISAYGKCGQWQKAFSMHKRMKEVGIRPNVVTYSALISACEKSGRWREAMKVFFDMRRDKVKPNSTTYNALISACEKGVQWELALEVFDWMKEQKVEADTITYSALISACEKGGQWQKAMQVFGWMSMAGVKANVVTYSALISACEKGAQWELALEVFEEMKRAGVNANQTTFNALISACEKGSQWRRALEVAAWMDEAGIPKCGALPCFVLWRSAVRCPALCFGAVRRSAVAALLCGLAQCGALPCFVLLARSAVRCLLCGLAQCGALPCFVLWAQCGALPCFVLWRSADTITYSALISACAKGSELSRAFKLYDEMSAAGVPVNIITQCSLMEVAMSSKEVEVAVEVRHLRFPASPTDKGDLLGALRFTARPIPA
ncbi:hypothetical protein CYMTET_17536 [Cymbomonas tetramitiformis]|uniref:Pentatricopeptide repeat-containing protein-mitochondrial domain-containing protein n=1 Tax=Cymbomonas tetramitiformis TaxID=36881 RepID=A0AAE0L6W2_9CHLO|nr:hypothetical protein CYMTET_17536 [Cymbomonas tetramitiformis]